MSAGNIFKACVVILLTLLGAYVLISGYRILIVLAIAFIIASALRPIVQTLMYWHIPEGVAIGMTYLVLIALAVLIFIVVLPPIVTQFFGYIENDNRLANRIIAAQTFFQGLIRDATNQNISIISEEDIRANVANFIAQLRASTPTVINNVGSLAGDFILIFVIGVYWLTSHDKAINFISELSPTAYKGVVDDVINEIETTMGNYTRGVFTVGTLVGLLNFIPMFLLGVPNALLVATVIGLTTTIPMVGGVIGGFIAVVLTILISYQHALIVLVIFLIVQQIENNFLSPRIMGNKVGLDPLLVIVYTSIGFVVGGVIGALLAVPVMATLHVLLEHFVLKPYIEEVSDFETDGGILLIKDRSKPENGNAPKEILTTEPKPTNGGTGGK